MIAALILFSFLAGALSYKYFIPKTINNNEPPLLDTPEQIISYLEACTFDSSDGQMNKLVHNFSTFISQKALPESAKDPMWFHFNDVKTPPEEHWNLFLTELKREIATQDKINVVKHWFDMEISFTDKEKQLILEHFDDSNDRAIIRDMILLAAKNKRKTT